MAEILLCPVGALSASDVSALRKAGVVVVRTNEPEKCRFIRASHEVSDSDMLWAALKALNYGTSAGAEAQREQVARILFALVDVKRKANEQPEGGTSE